MIRKRQIPRGAVAAGHPKTAEAAALVLREGGNAYDAAVAAAWAACVAEPVLTSLGGGGFLLARPRAGAAVLYDFCAQTPLERRPAEETDFFPIVVEFGTAQQEFHIGLGSVATPGVVAGLFRAHRELCRMPMKRLVEPAAALAREGSPIEALQAFLFAITAPIHRHDEQVRRIYGSREKLGSPLQEGERLVQPELADTIEALAHEGEELLYRGEIGARIAAQCTAGGGHLTRADLERYRVEPRRPLELDFRRAKLLLNPPPSSGGVLVGHTLALLDRLNLDRGPGGFSDVRLLTALALAMERTNEARRANLSGKEHQPGSALAVLAEDQLAKQAAALAEAYHKVGGTTHLSVIDRAGNVASLTTSNGEGAGYVIPGTGVLLNNMLGEDDINPRGFHRWVPDTRIASMMAPAIATRGGLTIATGSGGSKRIRTCLVQVLFKLLHLGLPVEEAVGGPRIHMEEDGLLSIEGGFPGELCADLQRIFPNHEVWDSQSLFFGGAHTVVHDAAAGTFAGAGDLRRGGVAAVVD